MRLARTGASVLERIERAYLELYLRCRIPCESVLASLREEGEQLSADGMAWVGKGGTGELRFPAVAPTLEVLPARFTVLQGAFALTPGVVAESSAIPVRGTGCARRGHLNTNSFLVAVQEAVAIIVSAAGGTGATKGSTDSFQAIQAALAGS